MAWHTIADIDRELATLNETTDFPRLQTCLRCKNQVRLAQGNIAALDPQIAELKQQHADSRSASK